MHFFIGLLRVQGLQKMQEQINQLMKLLTLAKVDIIAKIPQSSGKRTVVNRRDGAIFQHWTILQPLPNSIGHEHAMSKLHYLQILIDHAIHPSSLADKLFVWNLLPQSSFCSTSVCFPTIISNTITSRLHCRRKIYKTCQKHLKEVISLIHIFLIFHIINFMLKINLLLLDLSPSTLL